MDFFKIDPLRKKEPVASGHKWTKQMLSTLHRLSKLTRKATMPQIHPGVVGSLEGAISLKKIIFSYQPEAPTVLNEVSFQVAAGEKVAIVGACKSGKSTLAKVLAGQLEPQDGELLFDGHLNERVNPKAFKKDLTYMCNKNLPHLGSILSQFEGQTNDRAVWEALETVGLDSMVASLPKKLFGDVSDLRFKPAEMQLFEIARMLTKSPNILIIDEAMSHLGKQERQKFYELLQNSNMSCVFLSQNPSDLTDINKIIVLKEGYVAAIGTHEALMGSCPSYQELF